MLLFTARSQLSRADFIYVDFNETSGLRYNGDATTTSCDDGKPYVYNAPHGKNDAYDNGTQIPWIEETTDVYSEQTSMTFEAAQQDETTRYLAEFPHRDAESKAPDPAGCPLRLRLTPARPYKVGSVMRIEAAPVLNGFETGFSFQMTDHSRFCTLVKDSSFGTQSHRSCSIRGGDGLAFLLHSDANGSAAIGAGGSGMGYAGIRNGIAFEFDTLYNGGMGTGSVSASGNANAVPGSGDGTGLDAASQGGGGGVDADLVYDHVSIQASAGAAGATITQGLDTRLVPPKRIDIGDGAIHTVKIVYWPYIRYDLVSTFSSSLHAASFLLDEGDDRRIGTLAVYVDDMTTTNPLLALPININTVLRQGGQGLENQVWMGFTAATGNAWQKHDVIDWYFCELPSCPLMRGNPALIRYYR